MPVAHVIMVKVSHDEYRTVPRRVSTTVSQKNCAKLFLPELRQMSTNFDNFWQKDGKEAKIMRGALIFLIN